MTQPDATQLHPFIVDHFSLDELKTLCFNLGIEFDDLGGDTRQGKARELVKAMQRQTRLDHLAAHLSLARPDAYRQRFHQSPTIPATPARLRRNPRQIFISHATADADFAHRLKDDLEAEGWRVWIAPDSIGAGEKWVEAIDRGLETSGVFVVALTPEAVASRWVRTETNAAIALEHRGKMRFLPLDLAECDLPVLWSGYQYVGFRRSYEAGLDELLCWLEGPLPNPLPRGEGTGSPQVNRGVTVPPAPALPRSPALPDRRIHEKTGIELIRIPAGPFLYGSADSDKMAWDDEKPQRTVELPEYWIGRYPVTNDQFARFVRATGHKTTAEQKGQGRAWTGSKWEWVKGADWLHPGGPATSSAGKGNHPVVQVSWDDAKAFCDWAGLALPTEEQWEKAARGTDGRIWPWGSEPPTAERCNFDMNVKDTTPVGKYSPLGDSPYGCADVAGNVWEWTASEYGGVRGLKVLRGGSWVDDARLCRCALRFGYDPNFRGGYSGLRALVAPS